MDLNKLKDELAKDNVVIGSKKTIKYLKNNKLKLILLAENCPENIRKDIKSYVKINKIEIQNYDGTAKQLGIFCGKPFSIATLGVKE